ncbi:cysteine desulfurase family protein, partial [Actinotalea sp. C106]|uniref:cysteine desulfurase family protein n=1 Tax=Actinotalea sp. C106 TaxID=2908644 RepID=UPI0020278ECC
MTVYLDHAATTPMHPRAVAAMVEQLARTGNPSSLHGAGRTARRVVEESRESLGAALGARPSEVVLTAGGTEADNLAIKGLAWARRARDPRRRRVLVSAVEHHAVLDPAVWLAEHEGFEVVLLPVDRDGRLEVDALAEELAAHGGQAALISVMWANNEIGTVQPLDEVVSLAGRHGVPVHADAVQAVGQLEVDFTASGLDAMTVSGHKVGGPVGVGALVARRGLDLTPVLHGGGQERAVRSGTVDVASARAIAVAVEDAVTHRATHAERLAGLRDALVAGVRDGVPEAVL